MLIRGENNMKLFKNKLIILGVMVIVIVVGLYFYLKKIYSIDTYVNNLMTYLKDINCNKLYELSDKPSGMMTTKDIYVSKCSTFLNNNKIQEFYIDEIKYKENYYLANITYTDLENNENNLELKVKSNGKKLLLFNNWKSNYEVVPSLTNVVLKISNYKVKLMINDKEIPYEVNDENQTVYTIGNMYKGEYNAVIKYSKDYSLNTIINVDKSDYQLPKFSLAVFNETELSQLEKYITETKEYLEKGMFARKAFNKTRFPSTSSDYKTYYNSQVKYYKSIRKEAYIDHYSIKNLTLTGITLKENGNIQVKYKNKYGYRENWVGSEYYNHTETENGTMELKKVNGTLSFIYDTSR